MNEHLLKASAFIEAREPRERYILIALTVALIYFLAEALFLGGLFAENAKLKQQLASVQSTNESIQREADYASTIFAAQQQASKANHDALQSRMQRLNKQLESATSGFVPANEMPKLLEQVLVSHKGLALLGLQNLAVQTIYSPEPNDANTTAQALYRHGVKIELQGGYNDALSYLEALEQLPWHFEWDSLSYIIEAYPAGRLTLEVYTYSGDKEWLGV